MRARRLRALCVLCAWIVLTALLAGAARAGEKSAVVDGVRVSFLTHWPSALNRGWQPVQVIVENLNTEERAVELRLGSSAMFTRDEVTRALRVPAGGVERFELALPVRPSASNAYTADVRARASVYLSGIGAEQSSSLHERIVLVARRVTPGGVELARWSEALSREAAPRATVVGPDLSAFGRRGGHPGRIAPAAVSGVADSVKVSGCAYEHLSALTEAYASLHALVLDVGGGDLPARAALDAALAWARSGGVLVVTGRGAADGVRGEAALAAWSEPRFLARVDGAVATHALGLGLLVLAPGDGALDTPEAVLAVNAAIEALAPHGRDRARSVRLEIPGVEVPVRPLTLVLLLFALIVGPVNLIWVRRAKRPALLLVTIPGIALVFALFLVAYGIAAQGLDVRAATSSVAVLDQRAHRASGEEQRELYAGLAAGPGLRPGPGTIVTRFDSLSWVSGSEQHYRVDHDRGAVLGGAWLPVRTEMPVRIATDRAVRARIDLARGPEGWTLTNGLESDLLDLVFRDADGALHVFEGTVAPGRALAGRVAGTNETDLMRLHDREVLALPVEDGGLLPRGTWISRVARSPAIDTLGLEYQEVRSNHVLLGVLDLAEAGR